MTSKLPATAMDLRGWARKQFQKSQQDMELVKFQEANCKPCRFADRATVGTGKPCCTYPGSLLASSDKCLVVMRK